MKLNRRLRTKTTPFFLFLALLFCIQLISCSTSGRLSQDVLDRYLSEGEALASSGDHPGAVQLYRTILQRHPGQQKILYNLALALASDGDLESAKDTLTELNGISGGRNVFHLKALGGICAISDDQKCAEEVWTSVLELDPMDLETRNRLVSLLESQQRYAQAYEVAYEAFNLRQYGTALFGKLAELEVQAGLGDGASWNLLSEAYE